MSKIRVLMADDCRPLLESVLRLLGPGFEIVGEAQNGQALVAAALKLKPDVTVTDISMPILNGIEAANIEGALRRSLGQCCFCARSRHWC